jgi:lysophospholipase L1-like esterase
VGVVNNIQSRKILFLGNSLTACISGVTLNGYRMPNTLYSSVVGVPKNYALATYALGGRTGTQILAAWSTIVSNFNPRQGDVVIVWEGINDLGSGGKTAAETYQNLVDICTNVRNTGAKAVLVDIIPANMTGTYPNWETNRGTVNTDLYNNRA